MYIAIMHFQIIYNIKKKLFIIFYQYTKNNSKLD